MKSQLCLAMITLFAGAAFAQNPAPQQPAAPAQDAKAAGAAPAAEMKTRSYSGILTDASCAAKSAPSTPAAAGADRATAPDQGQSCAVSSSTTQFALKLKDGQVVKLDHVGNMRAQEALKSKKKWSEAAASGKAIQASANGVLNGEQLITMSIK